MFPKIGVPQNGWLILENPIKMDDLGVPLFSETSICNMDTNVSNNTDSILSSFFDIFMTTPHLWRNDSKKNRRVVIFLKNGWAIYQ